MIDSVANWNVLFLIWLLRETDYQKMKQTEATTFFRVGPVCVCACVCVYGCGCDLRRNIMYPMYPDAPWPIIAGQVTRRPEEVIESVFKNRCQPLLVTLISLWYSALSFAMSCVYLSACPCVCLCVFACVPVCMCACVHWCAGVCTARTISHLPRWSHRSEPKAK